MSGVWAWIECKDGKGASVSWEALGVAKTIAGGVGGPVTAVVFGNGAGTVAQEAIQRGADKAIACEDPTLANYRLEPYADLLGSLAKERGPAAIVAGQTTDGVDVMAAVAVDLEAGLISDVTALAMDGAVVKATVPVYSGKLLATVMVPEGTQMIAVRSRAFPAPAVDASRSGEVEMVGAARAAGDIATTVKSFVSADSGVSLTDASIIVSGGRGVGGPEGFEPIRDLADALNAAVGASRAVVDAGWIAYEHQVGQTGKVVSPDLYIACGISGAVQHQAGMRTSKVIVAINKDADAPIFKLAHYGVVGDLFQIVPALAKVARERLK